MHDNLTRTSLSKVNKGDWVHVVRNPNRPVVDAARGDKPGFLAQVTRIDTKRDDWSSKTYTLALKDQAGNLHVTDARYGTTHYYVAPGPKGGIVLDPEDDGTPVLPKGTRPARKQLESVAGSTDELVSVEQARLSGEVHVSMMDLDDKGKAHARHLPDAHYADVKDLEPGDLLPLQLAVDGRTYIPTDWISEHDGRVPVLRVLSEKPRYVPDPSDPIGRAGGWICSLTTGERMICHSTQRIAVFAKDAGSTTRVWRVLDKHDRLLRIVTWHPSKGDVVITKAGALPDALTDDDRNPNRPVAVLKGLSSDPARRELDRDESSDPLGLDDEGPDVTEPCRPCKGFGLVRGVGKRKGERFRTYNGALASQQLGNAVECPACQGDGTIVPADAVQ